MAEDKNTNDKQDVTKLKWTKPELILLASEAQDVEANFDFNMEGTINTDTS